MRRKTKGAREHYRSSARQEDSTTGARQASSMATATPSSPLTRRTLLDVGVPGLPIGIAGQRFLQQQSSSLSYTQQLHPLNSRRGGSSSISARTAIMLTLSLDLLGQ
jgi:hypothetical protein